MSSRTKIIVLHLKEIIYTVVFLLLGLLLIALLFIMFRSHKDSTVSEQTYTPGVYTSTLTLGSTNLEVEVSVDEAHINSVRFANLDESVTTSFPLIQPALEEIAQQLYDTQSLDSISYSADAPYTSKAIVDAISQALEKAAAH
ncbi:FMN-binding protein [Hespellia stercorisuis]|uniref:FMN-binding domain-containing protein n=1 Tax=Hespellia stercorisuis DSM 15480 TaxID=1121950 RepID=A0A1M6IKD7_9FIRM|nr:hypothetical protein [Hespellia stercorisuis]SHJ34941.1 hypothetical protein SAMN02745243_00377 [Hespellia stercorisuis DSM 15480]